ncbi:hypothetical protein Ndes2526A_g02120 [Nannochloris sp. 'desiccata']
MVLLFGARRPLMPLQIRITNSNSRPLRLVTTCAIKARWCLDIKYGAKMEAVALLQEWVREIGSIAGLGPTNAAINSGAVGTPESRLELEVTFDTLAEVEQFWASIPPEQHKIWSQKIQTKIVDGSSQWELYRTVETFPSTALPGGTLIIKKKSSRTNSAASTTAQTSSGGGLVMASEDDLDKYGAGTEPYIPSASEETASGLAVVRSEEEADEILDWKGDPMKINPGDRLPFKF